MRLNCSFVVFIILILLFSYLYLLELHSKCNFNVMAGVTTQCVSQLWDSVALLQPVIKLHP